MTALCLICGEVFSGNTCPKCGEGTFRPAPKPEPVKPEPVADTRKVRK